MTDKRISVIHATRNNAMQANVTRAVWLGRADNPETIEYIFAVDADDDTYVALDGNSVGSKLHGAVCATNCAVGFASGELICLAADDYTPPPGWDTKLLTILEKYDGPLVIAVSDGVRKDQLLTHPVLNRARLQQQGGVIVDNEYQESSGLYADNEFTCRAYRDHVVVEARDIVFCHDWKGGTVAGHNSQENYRKGREIFERRNGTDYGKVAVALRYTSFDPTFFLAWTRLIASGLNPGDRILDPAFRMSQSIACNYLLLQFLESDCDSLLFVDDDHDVPADALRRLRHTMGNYDAISALTVTRRGSFHPIALKMENDKYVNVKLPRGVVEVDAVGFGFTLIRRAIVEKIVAQNSTKEIFHFDERYGEDGCFSQAIKGLGGRMAVNCDVKMGHNTQVSLWWNEDEGKTEMRFQSHGIGHDRTETVEFKEGD